MKILNEEIRYLQLGNKFFIETGSDNETANIRTAFQKFGGYAYGSPKIEGSDRADLQGQNK